MNITDYHAKYFAHELTKRCSSDSLEKLAGAVAGAQPPASMEQATADAFLRHLGFFFVKSRSSRSCKTPQQSTKQPQLVNPF